LNASVVNDSANRPVLGCIADDVTGATDLGLNLVQGGMRVAQVLGMIDIESLSNVGDFDAIVVALKTRSIDPDDAVRQSLEATRRLEALGVQRFYFKYCSTFDSTDRGNIGPVGEALLRHLSGNQTIFCPAFPRAGRTVYQGHLFVGDKLLCQSGMEHHPLNPMRDANLVRVLGRQSRERVGLLPHQSITRGADRCAAELRELAEDGIKLVVVDTCNASDLETLATVAAPMVLVTGGSGLARYLPAAFRQQGLLSGCEYPAAMPAARGRSAILAGSCSQATQAQVAWMKQRCPSWQIDVHAVLNDAAGELERVMRWASEADPSGPIMIASTADRSSVGRLQERFGVAEVAAAIEEFFGSLAFALRDRMDIRRWILAGGETAGAVVRRLGICLLRIGPEICPGVPWTETLGDRGDPLAVAFKSGNFGPPDFFKAALEMDE